MSELAPSGGPAPAPIPCAAGLVYDERGRLLLVRRGREPEAGLWSVPGGRIEPGESSAAAAVREVREETGLAVVAESMVGAVLRRPADGAAYAIDDWRCRPVGRTDRLVPGDDATDARFVTLGELRSLPCTPGLHTSLEEWSALPTAR